MLTGGIRFDRRSIKLSRGLAYLALAVLLALALTSCGGSESQPPQPSNLIGTAELTKSPENSPERSFLNLWSALQYQSWAEVASYYSPALRRFIGTAMLVGAKKVDASTFPVTKPKIVRTEDEGNEATIAYSILLPEGTPELGSTTWRREDGNWRLIYDSRLDPELNQFARNQVEIEEKGALSTDPSEPPSAAASRAGVEASHLQAEFLQSELGTEGP